MKHLLGPLLVMLLFANDARAQATSLDTLLDVTQSIGPSCAGAQRNGTDDGPEFQCHIDYLSNLSNGNQGGVLFVPAGTYTINTGIVVKENVTLLGTGQGTILAQNHSYLGNLVKMQIASTLSRMKLTQLHPGVGQSWTPYTDYDYQISVEGDKVTLSELMLLSPYKGIRIMHPSFPNTCVGQTVLNNIRGQPLGIGILFEGICDIVRVSDLHFWPFWNVSPVVVNYTQNNAIGMYSNRNDGPMISQAFFFGYSICAYFGESFGGTAAGSTKRAQITSMYCDFVKTGIQVGGSYVQGLSFDKLVVHMPTPTGSFPLPGTQPSIIVSGANADISLSAFEALNSAVNVIRVLSNNSTVNVINGKVRDWNVSGLGFPAFDVVSPASGSQIYISNIFYKGGLGAPLTGSGVTASATYLRPNL